MLAKDIKVGIAPENGDKESPTESALSTIDTKTNLEAALILHEAGFQPIPIIPGKKIPTCKHHPWLDDLSVETINAHWTKHPKHEVGCITGANLVVFDVDSPESKARLLEIEEAFDVTPNFVVNTAKGSHHYFTLAMGTFVKSDAHGSLQHPDRIDVRTGSGLVIMPPSTGKEIALCEIAHVRELAVADQNFVDAVFRHNGRPAPRKQISVSRRKGKPAATNQQLKELDALLSHLDPNCGYQDWITPGMATHHESGGSEEGLSIWDDWSSQGDDYPGPDEVRAKWQSFEHRSGNPVTIRTLCKMAEDNGHDWLSILDRLGPQFEKCHYFRTVQGESLISGPDNSDSNILSKFSLIGKSIELEAQALAEVYVLSGIALLGQWTIFFSRANTGKTLLVLYLLIEAIQQGRIRAQDVFYFNLDDNHSGLTTKTKIAEEVGFHVICDGYEGFKVSNFIHLIEELISKDQARGIVLVLDTLKKFTSLMDKIVISKWNQIMRRFVVKGGTVIALAHTNKRAGNDGKPIPTGVSDLVDDVDCSYTIDVVDTDQATQTKTIVFENIKRRGNVVNTAAYRYSIEDGLNYEQLLATVEKVDQTQLVQIKKAEANKSDAEIIDAITNCIGEGINARMRLRDEVNERAGISKRKVLNIIDTYTGKDPDQHHWFYTTQKHGRKVYQLLT
jgi:hypothetical protein